MKANQLPIRRNQFATSSFAGWLAENGAEVKAPTNPYELVRYLAYEPGSNRATTHIVYTKDTGLLTFTGASKAHYAAFLRGDVLERSAPAPGNPPGGWQRDGGGPFNKSTDPLVSPQAKRRQKLLERDGDGCWFCGLAMGADMTIEHLIPRSKGGRDSLSNYALAHQRCNAQAANIPLVQKIELRAAMRVASVGRNAERQAAQRLGPKDEHAVPAEERTDAQTPPVSTKKGA